MDPKPISNLDGYLLAGRIFVGPFARARPSEALVQLLTPDQIPLADSALRAWLKQVIGAPAQEHLRANASPMP